MYALGGLWYCFLRQIVSAEPIEFDIDQAQLIWIKTNLGVSSILRI